MGYFSELHAKLMEEAEPGPEDYLESNEYEEALENGERYMGDCKFVRSCREFYEKNEFLTEKQMYRLNNPRF